ncbi:glycerophosphoryl diester phosphodiesterase membrane domain-containing protein [Leifsonia poae]|uniref:glycerophosphoryl diester phosphodiesterase membrane domain-containing protein n=1 Tax=Leifsonia poae TaxID=110933 RepID=UPI003D66C7B7
MNYFAVLPAINGLFGLALTSAHLEQVTDRTLGDLLVSPLADLLLLAIAAIALIALTLQLSATVVMVNRQQTGRALTFSGIAVDTARAIRRVMHHQSAVLVVYLFVLAPLGGLGLFSVITRGVSIPPFVTREFMKTTAGGLGYMAVIGILMYLNLRLIHTLPLMFVGGRRPFRALVDSVRATRRRFWRTLLLIAVPVAAGVLMTTALCEALIGVTDAVSRVWPDAAGVVGSVSISAGHTIGFFLTGAVTVVVAQLLVADCREFLGLAPIELGVQIASKSRRAKATLVGARVAVASVILASGVAAAPVRAADEPASVDTVVLAHRGYSGGGVENTIAALDAAAKLHPDYVETDMQETKDGRFVASHDTNLLMVAGLNENIYDMTVDRVTKVVETEGGFTGTIPTMTDYVKRAAKLGVPLLIELKVHGHESPDYIDRFLAELDAAGVTDQNIYHSLSPEAVRGLKERRPELRVGYTIAMSIGAVPQLDCDFYVIEQASFNTGFLADAHAEGKPVYVWTVNDPVTIRKLMRDRVDGIVTDIPNVAEESRTQFDRTDETALHVADALSYLDALR